MKVRRKSEIVEAVQRANGWSIFYPTDTHFVSNETFAAHYEPVPEPPAQHNCEGVTCSMCSALRTSQPLGRITAPSVSEEQPAPTYKVLGTEKGFSPRLETEERIPAPHRATIAAPVFSYTFSTICKNCQRSYGEHLGNDCLISDTRFEPSTENAS